MSDLIKKLKDKSRWVWKETLKIHQRAPETRVASSLSDVEIFVTLYYGGILKHDPKNEYCPNRDRFIISKGHGSISMYPILADLGFFDLDELEKVCQEGSFLGGIPDPVIPGYETVNGSLGHGLGVASGMALALKTKESPNSVFVLSGDGELYEGSNWEAIMFAAHHKLDNLNLIVDCNKTSMLDHTDNIIDHLSLEKKFTEFGWTVTQVDGHDVAKLYKELQSMKENHYLKPKVLIAHTLKGHGVPSIENNKLSHIMGIKPDEIEKLIHGSEE
jgi:transketolase